MNPFRACLLKFYFLAHWNFVPPDLLLILKDDTAVFHGQIYDIVSFATQLIDFVPVEETQKAQARERYKILRSQGWTLSTENT